MFKKILFFAATAMFCSPAFVTAQDFFFSFDEFSRVPTATLDSDVTDTGSVFIFADENLDFNNLDLDFSTSNPSVAAFTGATTFNDGFKFTAFAAVDQNDQNAPPTATDGRLVAVGITIPDVVESLGQVPGSNDADFRPGANGFLLAQLDYDLGGGGIANFDFTLGDLGVANDGVGQIPVTFGSGALTVLGEPAPPFVPPVEPPVVPPVEPPVVPPVEPPVVPPVEPPVVPPVEPPVTPPVEPPVSNSGGPDLFFSFDQNSRVDNQTLFQPSGTAYIFADANLDFNQLDLDFTVDGASITDVTTFNADGKFTSLTALDPNDPNAPPTATDGRLAAIGITFPDFGIISPGQDPSIQDADFRPGANGFLLAAIDFEVDFEFAYIGGDVVNFDLVLGDLGIVNDGVGQVPVTLGSATLFEAEFIPEPSSAILLILGAAGMFARRRRS